MRYLAFPFFMLVADIAVAQTYWGEFDDGPSGKFRDADPWQEFVLDKDFAFRDPNGLEWKTPGGIAVNGASIPPMFWSFIGGPFTGKYLKASVIHDHYVEEMTRTAHDTHRNFYYGMRANGVPAWRAKTMYWAVRTFGDDWELSAPATVAGGAEQATFSVTSPDEIQQFTAGIARQTFIEVARNLKTSEGATLRNTFAGPIEATLDAIDADALNMQRTLAVSVPFLVEFTNSGTATAEMFSMIATPGVRDTDDLTLDNLPLWPDGQLPVQGGSIAQEDRFRDLFQNDQLFDFDFEVPG